jgi:hypothetical protein
MTLVSVIIFFVVISVLGLVLLIMRALEKAGLYSPDKAYDTLKKEEEEEKARRIQQIAQTANLPKLEPAQLKEEWKKRFMDIVRKDDFEQTLWDMEEPILYMFENGLLVVYDGELGLQAPVCVAKYPLNKLKGYIERDEDFCYDIEFDGDFSDWDKWYAHREELFSVQEILDILDFIDKVEVS